MTYNYIKNNVEGFYTSFDKSLDKNLYNIGYTYTDFENGLWVQLNNSQLKFKKEHPDASVRDVFYMKINESFSEISLSDAKNNKINEILNYDSSSFINIFCFNEHYDWWDKNQRMAIFHRLDIEKKLKKKVTTFWINKQKFEILIDKAYDFLYKLEEYAITCLDVTNNHILNINNMNNIDEINNYNYKTGYPIIINYTI